jgi:glutamate-1-semialdehyde 2,1-aminomutase
LHRYFDFVGELSAGLYGHSNPQIHNSITSTLKNSGVNLGATTQEETRFAELICDRFPAIEQLRFCNSGTEANLYAIAVARHVTSKRKVVVFEGGYHGGVLSFGHGIASSNVDINDWKLGQYNDVEGTMELLQNQTDVAAVIVEGMQGAGGCIPATEEFLKAIQTTAAKVYI